MTAAAAVPTEIEGRNGQVRLPMMWAADGAGALSCRMVEGGDDERLFQVESYRNAGGAVAAAASFLTGGLMPAARGGTRMSVT
jgi:hypothetical protein